MKLSYTDLPKIFIESSMEAPFSVLIIEDDIQKLIYTGDVDILKIRLALNKHGIYWNVQADDLATVKESPNLGILYSKTGKDIDVVLVSAYTTTEGESYEYYRDNNIYYDSTTTIQPFELYYINFEGLLEVATDVSEFHGIGVTAYAYTIDTAPTPNRKVIVLSNQSAFTNLSGSVSTASVVNEGIEDIGSSDDFTYDICLSKRIPLEDGENDYSTQCIEFSGRFAIEINGVMIPYSFAAEDLPLYFNGVNNKQLLIKECTNFVEPVECIPTILSYPVHNLQLDGSWVITYKINDGPTEVYSQVDHSLISIGDLMIEFLNTVIDKPNADAIVNLGGSTPAYFQKSSGNRAIEGGKGDISPDSVRITIFKNTEYDDDLFPDLVDSSYTDDYIELISCGYTNFEAY